MVLTLSTKTSYEHNKNMLVYYYSNWLELVPFDCGQANYRFLIFKRKSFIQQNGSQCWNYSNGRGVYSLGMWDGGNGPHGPYFLWQAKRTLKVLIHNFLLILCASEFNEFLCMNLLF
jgi:hypothetical protein